VLLHIDSIVDDDGDSVIPMLFPLSIDIIDMPDCGDFAFNFCLNNEGNLTGPSYILPIISNIIAVSNVRIKIYATGDKNGTCCITCLPRTCQLDVNNCEHSKAKIGSMDDMLFRATKLL
jgi:hypothetical protein